MASLAARLVGEFLRTTGLVRRRFSDGPALDTWIVRSRIRRDLPTAKMHAELHVSKTNFEGRDVWQIAPKAKPATAHVLYYHGGGFVYPPAAVHWQFYAHLARTYGLAITAPLYPLAPEAQVRSTTDWALRHYQAYCEQHKGPFVLGGDSAGGGLASVIAQKARDDGMRQADALLLICPWLDLALSNPEQHAIEPRDGVLTIRGARSAGLKYAGQLSLEDPRVSPIHGDWKDMPPILVFGGGDDILVPDARRLASMSPEAHYVEGAGLMHDWPIFFLPESRKAQAHIAQFVFDNAIAGGSAQ